MKNLFFFLSLIATMVLTSSASFATESTKFGRETKFVTATHFVPDIVIDSVIRTFDHVVPIPELGTQYEYKAVEIDHLEHSVPILTRKPFTEFKLRDYTKTKRKFSAPDGFNYKKHYRKSKRAKFWNRFLHRSGCRNK